jgi:uncharacterized protein DUF4189
MKNLARGIVLAVVLCALGICATLKAGGNRYAAVAFSPSTGLYGYGNGYSSKDEAVERALQECGGRDAVTKWCRNSWIALAISRKNPGGYGWAWAESAGAARSAAIDNCREHNSDAHVVVCVSAYR